MSNTCRKFVAALAVLSFCVLTNTSWAEAIKPGDVKIVDGEVKKSLTGKAGNVDSGRKLYFNRKLGNCLACHANKDLAKQPFHGEIGPSLDGVAGRYSEAQLRAIIVNPKKALSDSTIMPAFYRVINDQRTRKEFHNKTIVNAQQVEDLIAYLKTLK